jgi:VIT1/CCC1 family predicted Fe2+/Mn2+ transporter
VTPDTTAPGHAPTRRGRFAKRMGRHVEQHHSDRIGWLRAAVLGANDGIVSTASLVLGVAAAGAEHRTILLTSLSGLIAGAMSMAAGEFVSVHAQQDTENADLTRERTELQQDPEGEQRELAGIYVGRGLDQPLADRVASQLMAHAALAAHARDELGLSDTTAARPAQAAWASAASFSVGAMLPIAVVATVWPAHLSLWVCISSLAFLAGLGALSARLGGAQAWNGIWRVTFWGAVAMGVTAAAGAVFGAVEADGISQKLSCPSLVYPGEARDTFARGRPIQVRAIRADRSQLRAFTRV